MQKLQPQGCSEQFLAVALQKIGCSGWLQLGKWLLTSPSLKSPSSSVDLRLRSIFNIAVVVFFFVFVAVIIPGEYYSN